MRPALEFIGDLPRKDANTNMHSRVAVMSLRPPSRAEADVRPLSRPLLSNLQQLFDLGLQLRLLIGLGKPRQVGESAGRQIRITGGQQDRQVDGRFERTISASSMPVISGMA